MSQARRTRHFARSAKRALGAKCHERLLCRLAAPQAPRRLESYSESLERTAMGISLKRTANSPSNRELARMRRL